jgi:hypothetical protein
MFVVIVIPGCIRISITTRARPEAGKDKAQGRRGSCSRTVGMYDPPTATPSR